MWVGVVTLLVGLQLVAPDGALGWWTYYVAIALAVGTAWAAVATGSRHRVPCVLLACGVTASGLADAIYDVRGALAGAYPDVSVSDVGWLLSYLFVAGALVVLLRSDGRVRGRDVDGVVDMLIVMVVAAAAVWYLWVVPMAANGSASWLDRLVLVSYPVLDVALLGLVVRSALSARRHSEAIRLVAAGAACWLISDFAFQAWGEVGIWTGIEAAGWMLGSCLFAAAGWSLRWSQRTVGDSRQVRAGRWRVGVALAMFVVPWFFELDAFANGQVVDPLPLLLVSVALAGLTYVRMTNLLEAQQLSEERVAASERRYRALAANSSDAAVVVTAAGDILSGGDSLDGLMGESMGVANGANLIELAEQSPDGGMTFREMFGRCLGLPGTVFEVEMCMPSAGGSVRWLGARAVNLMEDDDVAGVIVNFHDVTDRRRVEEEIRHHAFHDTLTGLANRALLLDRLEHAVRQSERTGWDPAVLFVDLDGFKSVNDTLGHDAGDSVLREVTERISRTLRNGDTLGRIGGDEFVVLVEQSYSAVHDATLVATRILEGLTAPIAVGDQTISLSASIGIAAGHPSASPESLLREADIAMYQAKTGGRSRWTLYAPEMQQAAVRRFQIDNDIRQALHRHELRLEYQPVVRLDTQEILGVEALLRWDHPTLGPVPPDVFVPLAERNGSIVSIGRWVLHTACEQAASWKQELGQTAGFSLAVNTAASQLTSEHFYDDTVDALTRSGLSPGALVIEITETALIENTDDSAAVLNRLRQLGVRVAIDDFGTGYSSLGYLQTMPVDILKIDRSFVHGIYPGTQVPDVVRGIVDLARTLHIETIAEGVETASQADQLNQLHCNNAQGYLYSRPLQPHLVRELLRRGKPIPDRAGVNPPLGEQSERVGS
jgi:diguanylate cyclase (GGDEF)-like protein/PAS domain S-box-containing protein